MNEGKLFASKVRRFFLPLSIQFQLRCSTRPRINSFHAYFEGQHPSEGSITSYQIERHNIDILKERVTLHVLGYLQETRDSTFLKKTPRSNDILFENATIQQMPSEMAHPPSEQNRVTQLRFLPALPPPPPAPRGGHNKIYGFIPYTTMLKQQS